MSRPRKRPLDSPNWWLLGRTLQHCKSQPLFTFADLVAAIEQEAVHVKLEYLDRSTKPARRRSKLLTSELPQLFISGTGWRLNLAPPKRRGCGLMRSRSGVMMWCCRSWGAISALK
jgi:hypothetical protein